VRCFTATCENDKFQHGAFLLSTLAFPLTELSKVFQAGYFDFAQMKFSVELCVNKLYDAAAESELEANCGKFDSELGELGTLDDLAESCVSSGMAFWKSAESFSKFSVPIHKRETGVNEPTTAASLCFVSQKECMPRCHEKIEPKLDDSSCGFCRGCNTKETISTLQQIFKNSWDDAKDLYTCFVDLGKVYGLVLREKLWGCYGSTVLTGACCWLSSNCIPDKKIVSAPEG